MRWAVSTFFSACLFAAISPLAALAQSEPWHYVVLDPKAGSVQELTNSTGVLFTNRYWDSVNGAKILTSGIGAEQFNSINNLGLAVGIRQGIDPSDTRPSCAYKNFRAISHPAQNLIQYGLVDAYDVNDAGEIVGVCELPCSSGPDGSARIIACRIANGTRTDLSMDNSEPFATPASIGAFAINQSGQIAANGPKIVVPGTPPVTKVYPFLYDPVSGIYEIPFDSATTSAPTAVDINDAGDLVGWFISGAGGPNPERRAFLYSIAEDFRELPIDYGPFPTDINSAGTIIGLWKNGVFIYDQQDGPRDLMDVYPPAANGFAGWYYESTGRPHINDRGEIVIGLVKGGSPSNPGGITDFRTVIITPGAAPPNPLPPPDTNSQVVYALWNGFLSMTNILELLNSGMTKLELKITIVGADGVAHPLIPMTLDPSLQQDIILTDLPGFSKDAYGLVRIEYKGTLDGRMFYYRTAPNGQDFEFAFGVPFSPPVQGTSSVGFNTYNPSTNPADAGFPVANWLSIVNLSTTVQTYTVKKYDQIGALVDTPFSVALDPLQRFDLDGGHGKPGPNRVGLNVMVPEDPFAPYLAQLIRYGASSTGFRFAFSLAPGVPEAGPIFTPLATSHETQNWLEVVNPTDQFVTGFARIYSSTGGSKDAPFGLPPFSQQHIPINGILGNNDTGFAEIVSTPDASVIAQSMHYFRDSANGGILGMYGSQSRHTTGSVLNGSYNLFLGMADELKISNVTGIAKDFNLNVFRPNGTSTFQQHTLNPHATRVFLIHDTQTFGTSPNTYGAVTLQSAQGGDLLSEMVRLRFSPVNGKLDFAAPTNVR